MPTQDIFYPPRGLNREDAARWIGVGATTFDKMVDEGKMPKPRMINSRIVWDRFELDQAFSDLPRRDEKTKAQEALERLAKS